MARAGIVGLVLFALGPLPALASDNTEGLDSCIAAALQHNDGIVVEWEVEDGTGRGFLMQTVAKDGKLWSVSCVPSTTELHGPDRGLGTMDYATLSSRAKISEARAREAVRTFYPGRFIAMEYKLTWRGGAVYAYTLVTPDDREATVEVDAATGRILRSRSSARY
jgi:uncharacterized membrane protein YkoI